MALRLGMRFDGFDPVGETIEIAARAEAAGANTIWMAEHLGYREAVVSCTAFLQNTSRAMVCPTAVMPYLWHPMPTAMQFATMAELAPGHVTVEALPIKLQAGGQPLDDRGAEGGSSWKPFL